MFRKARATALQMSLDKPSSAPPQRMVHQLPCRSKATSKSSSILYWLCFAAEATVILAQHFPTHTSAVLALELFNASCASSLGGRITTAFLFGSFLIITGALLRFRCFREMGNHFTFALSIREGHSLITTGPYSVVRHPAYTAGYMTIIGALLVLMGDGSWWLAVGKATGMGQLWAANFIISAMMIVLVLLRGAKEDSYLAKQFGKQWEAWAKNVPCRYIPGVV
ncbi:Protein-S-isoprenylcysteine O-methyltransferase B [Leucoagaricus sp. SymC.cos]|nr:Protein-S-isoprenylcysteine O-methyltransferase B [Leucoagaricus sp. SymC.cos]